MPEEEPTLKGKGLEIGHSDKESTLLGSLAARSILNVDETPPTEPTLRGKGLSIIDTPESDAIIEVSTPYYTSVKNGDSYEIVDGPVKDGLVRLRNTRNGSIATLSADVLSDSARFVPAAVVVTPKDPR